MPKGVYRKKTKRGFMYFRDGKLISKDSYMRSKARSKSVRSPKRNGGRPKAKSNGAKYMKKGIPHPSVTGMASGLAIASYLNSGSSAIAGLGRDVGAPAMASTGVLKQVSAGNLSKGVQHLANNAVSMVGSDTGRKTLVAAGGIALIGAMVRSRFPNLKLGGSKLYFRV